MGHEFSHVLNGDMRLNLRLIGVVYGILVLAVIGYYVMRSAGACSSRDSKGVAATRRPPSSSAWRSWYWATWACFLGKIIKAAISRQREFLADASVGPVHPQSRRALPGR